MVGSMLMEDMCSHACCSCQVAGGAGRPPDVLKALLVKVAGVQLGDDNGNLHLIEGNAEGGGYICTVTERGQQCGGSA